MDNDLYNPVIFLINEMDKTRHWSKQWLVSFNPSKTVNVNFCRAKRSNQPLSFAIVINIISESNNITAIIWALFYNRQELPPLHGCSIANLQVFGLNLHQISIKWYVKN